MEGLGEIRMSPGMDFERDVLCRGLPGFADGTDAGGSSARMTEDASPTGVDEVGRVSRSL